MVIDTRISCYGEVIVTHFCFYVLDYNVVVNYDLIHCNTESLIKIGIHLLLFKIVVKPIFINQTQVHISRSSVILKITSNTQSIHGSRFDYNVTYIMSYLLTAKRDSFPLAAFFMSIYLYNANDK